MSEKKEQIEYISEKVKKDLEKIFELNKKKIHKKNDNLIKFISNPALIAEAYDKIQKNKGAHTQGTDSETADAFGRIRLNRISEEIANGRFEWRAIKRKLRHELLSFPTFVLALVPKAIAAHDALYGVP